MEEPELLYCEVIDSEKDVQPPPLPKRRENIAASFIEMNLPGRIPLPRSPIIITANSCQRSQKHKVLSGKTQVLLSIAATIFAIISVVFMSLYFTAEAKSRSCECQHSLPNTNRDDMLCPRIVTNSGSEEKSNKTNNDTGKNTAYHLPSLFPGKIVLYLLPMSVVNVGNIVNACVEERKCP